MLGLPALLRDLGDDLVVGHVAQIFETLDEFLEPRFLGDLNVVPGIARAFFVGRQFGLIVFDLGRELTLDRSRVVVFELVELRQPAVRFGHFALAFGDFVVDPFGQRLVVHDDVDDREHGRQVAAPNQGDDHRR